MVSMMVIQGAVDVTYFLAIPDVSPYEQPRRDQSFTLAINHQGNYHLSWNQSVRPIHEMLNLAWPEIL